MATREFTGGGQSSADVDWDVVLAMIEDRSVVPIVGRDLLAVPGAGGPSFYYRELALLLAAALGIDDRDLPKDLDIEEVAFRYLQRSNDEEALYVKLKQKIQRYRPGIPEPLRQLAAIDSFPLVVSTTYDDLLASALREARGAARIVERAYLPSASTTSSQDLPGDLDGKAVVVYSLFGRPEVAGDYAVTEEETLEFVHELKAKLDPKQGELKNLGARLQKSHLLFLGCGFPDWLMRFFIRTLRGERFHAKRSRRARFVDRRADHQGNLVMFLQQYGTCVYGVSPVDFVAELERRWKERARTGTSGAWSLRLGAAAPIVVLACAVQDEPIARAVAARLERWGIGCAIVRAGATDDGRFRAALAACVVYVAYLSEGVIGGGPDERILDDWRKVDRRQKDAGAAALVTLIVTLDAAARDKLRDQRGWPEWLRRSHRPLHADDVILSVVEAAFASGRLGVRPRLRVAFVFDASDQKEAEKLERHLARATWLTVWHEGKLLVGERVGRHIDELSRAEIIVLLVSVDMLASRQAEVELALGRHERGEALVIPVLVRSCMLGDDLNALDLLPEDGHAIAQAESADLAWTKVATAVVLRAYDVVLGRGSPSEGPR